MIIGSMCAISDFLLLNEKTVEWCERTLSRWGYNDKDCGKLAQCLTYLDWVKLLVLT